jgi:hypothetical protein
MLYFRIVSDDVYEQTRQHLDAAWGLPNDAGTATCVDPAAVAPRDSQGRILLAVRPEFVAFDAVAAMLPQLLASGTVEEITADQYQPV